jgi:hypothetical protein
LTPPHGASIAFVTTRNTDFYDSLKRFSIDLPYLLFAYSGLRRPGVSQSGFFHCTITDWSAI